MEKYLYEFWFIKNEDISYGKKVKLIEYFYDSYNLFHASKSQLIESNLIDEATADKFIENRKKFDFHREYEKFSQTPFSYITIENPNYPMKLKNIYDPPYGLFYLGEFPDFYKTVSIVGARRCSAYGKRMALELGEKLGANGFTVISGMARGIDAYAHQGCLQQNGTTAAVLGSGCDVIYPSENRKLYEDIIAKGGVVISEYQMGISPVPMNFPRRNRIVSALSDAVVVIEARDKSGSLITADFALEHGKDIYVTPGRIGDSLSFGANRLISQGAGIIYDVDVFVEEMLRLFGEKEVNLKADSRPKYKLTSEQKNVYDLFDDYPKSLATVLEESKMDYLKLLSLVLSLEKLGLLAEVFKNNYTKVM